MYVYGSKKINLPEPELYVIFTGNRKFEKDTISLKEDFWKDPDAKIDLSAKAIYAENKDDIIGQYIIFSHVLDAQIKNMEEIKRLLRRPFEFARVKESSKSILKAGKRRSSIS